MQLPCAVGCQAHGGLPALGACLLEEFVQLGLCRRKLQNNRAILHCTVVEHKSEERKWCLVQHGLHGLQFRSEVVGSAAHLTFLEFRLEILLSPTTQTDKSVTDYARRTKNGAALRLQRSGLAPCSRCVIS